MHVAEVVRLWTCASEIPALTLKSYDFSYDFERLDFATIGLAPVER